MLTEERAREVIAELFSETWGIKETTDSLNPVALWWLERGVDPVVLLKTVELAVKEAAEEGNDIHSTSMLMGIAIGWRLSEVGDE